MCRIELCLGLKSLATATKKQNRKQKQNHQIVLPVQMSFEGFLETHKCISAQWLHLLQGEAGPDLTSRPTD